MEQGYEELLELANINIYGVHKNKNVHVHKADCV